MRLKALRVLIGLSLGALAGFAQSVPLTSIYVGDSYYLHRDLDDNLIITVVSVDGTRNLVKIQYKNGAVDWIAPGKLMTQAQNDLDEAAGAAAAVQIFACALDPKDPSCEKKPWAAGRPHSRYAHVYSTEKENTYIPAPGYKWGIPGTVGNVIWTPGLQHPKWPNVFSAKEPNTWQPDTGWVWQIPGTIGPVYWQSGPIAGRPGIMASQTAGQLKPSPGFRWANPTNPNDFTIVPVAPAGVMQSSAANFKYGTGTIFLGPDCKASSSDFGNGTWGWANGGVFINLAKKQNIGFPRAESPYSDSRCAL